MVYDSASGGLDLHKPAVGFSSLSGSFDLSSTNRTLQTCLYEGQERVLFRDGDTDKACVRGNDNRPVLVQTSIDPATCPRLPAGDPFKDPDGVDFSCLAFRKDDFLRATHMTAMPEFGAENNTSGAFAAAATKQTKPDIPVVRALTPAAPNNQGPALDEVS